MFTFMLILSPSFPRLTFSPFFLYPNPSEGDDATRVRRQLRPQGRASPKRRKRKKENEREKRRKKENELGRRIKETKERTARSGRYPSPSSTTKGRADYGKDDYPNPPFDFDFVCLPLGYRAKIIFPSCDRFLLPSPQVFSFSPLTLLDREVFSSTILASVWLPCVEGGR
ncbi:hypothetical protein IE53DRAFT_39938 [Violaceomyces palustris]|uniref:Uncharacterized protein n=1 Tax=Violaceomyces palustris TaxID=1673888 RepID=A0ACD0P0T3_9BASI|nr:hypothetical protein IE53DRAFT_39938 [Violaceomyces palustris]